MSTERPSARYTEIDIWEAAEIVEAMIEAQFAAVAAVHAARREIESAVLAMEARLRHRGRLIYTGAGTSGRLAVQDGAELAPTFGWPEERLLLLIAGGEDALLRSVEGAEDDAEQGTKRVSEHAVGKDDVLIAVAASGTTRFTLACLREGRQRGALTIGLANNRATPLLREADCPVFLDTGPEPIAGSTRLKAGTAQKIALNALSSGLMILLGKVHRGLMVDVRASNEKLLQRSENMLVHLTECSRDDARKALDRAGGSVKLAALLLHGCELDRATRLLDQSSGRLSEALDLLNGKRAG